MRELAAKLTEGEKNRMESIRLTHLPPSSEGGIGAVYFFFAISATSAKRSMILS